MGRLALTHATLLDTALARQQTLLYLDRLMMLEALGEGFEHEVRNPMAWLKSYVELVHKKILDRDALRRLAVAVQADGAQLEHLIQELVGYSRRQERPEYAPHDLTHIITDSFLFARAKTHHRGITLHQEFQPELPPVWGRSATAEADRPQTMSRRDPSDGVGRRDAPHHASHRAAARLRRHL